MAGIVASIIVFAVGAILNFAVTVSVEQHGFDIHTVGVILMIVGAVGFVISVIVAIFGSQRFRRRRTTIDDGTGRVVQREDRYS